MSGGPTFATEATPLLRCHDDVVGEVVGEIAEVQLGDGVAERLPESDEATYRREREVDHVRLTEELAYVDGDQVRGFLMEQRRWEIDPPGA